MQSLSLVGYNWTLLQQFQQQKKSKKANVKVIVKSGNMSIFSLEYMHKKKNTKIVVHA